MGTGEGVGMVTQLTGTRASTMQSAATFTLVLLCLGAFSGGLGVASTASTPGLSEMMHFNLAKANVHPAATPTCSGSGFCPSGVRTAYSFNSLIANSTMNGTGQAIVIIDACGDAAIASDVATFDARFGLPPINLTVYQPQGRPCSNPTGWGLETALDVEWAHAMAPGAAIHLVEAKTASNSNLYGAWNYSLTHKLGLVFSNSWGGSGGCPTVAKSNLNFATKLGVTILASAGDSGAWGSGQTLAAQQPSNCQTVVAVGGTTLKVGTGNAYSSESAWSGSGGGYVPSTTEPAYETTASISDPYSELAKPDVAAIADPSTGVWVYEKASGGWFVVGGTSVACPIWAAFLADVNSWRASNAFGGLGNLDPFLFANIYGVSGGSTNYSASMHDITSGSNGWSAGTGFDAATGIGSFQAYALANLLANNASA
jgi:subtilase family serine protease